MTASAIPALKAALFTLCQSTFDPPIQVVYGHPGTNLSVDIVAVRNADADLNWRPLGAQKKDEQAQVAIVFNCWRGGDQQQTVTERAFELLDLLDAELRKPAGDPTIGGVCRDATITAVSINESEPGITNPDGVDLMAKGRWTELVATITANVRL